MDAIKFAQLVSNITRQHAISFTETELKDMLETIKAGTIQPEVRFEPATHSQIMETAGKQVKEMLYAMNQNKRIEAIKTCRMLTGLGLKEAKDAIEWAMQPK